MKKVLTSSLVVAAIAFSGCGHNDDVEIDGNNMANELAPQMQQNDVVEQEEVMAEEQAEVQEVAIEEDSVQEVGENVLEVADATIENIYLDFDQI